MDKGIDKLVDLYVDVLRILYPKIQLVTINEYKRKIMSKIQ